MTAWVACYPRWAPSGARVQLVAAGDVSFVQPTWTCRGAAVEHKVLRPLTSVRGEALLGGANEPRAFTSLVEFPGLPPGRHPIEADVGGVPAECEVTVLPADLADAGDDGLKLLLVSCYHFENVSGLEGAVTTLEKFGRPNLALLMGDQIYGDLPTFKNFKTSESWLARKIEDDYARNWSRPAPFAPVLRAASTVSLSDDHEYWNNAPHVSPFLQNTWNHREEWMAAAKLNLDAFQPWPAEPEALVRIDVPPVSIVLAEGRRYREDDRSRAFAKGTPDKLAAWIDDCNAKQLHPVFVTGQSLFAEPIGELKGKVADWEMPNYRDYAKVLAALLRSARPLLCVTGDVHWGRVLRGIDTHGGADVYELIVSPSALVTDVSGDWAKKGWGWAKGLFGNKDPWPRHSKPDAAPPAFAKEALGRAFACKTMHEQVGDQLALLTFRLRAGKVQADVTYFPVTTEHMGARSVPIYPS